MVTWADGFEAYLQTYEVRLHKRTNTFGGTVWPETRRSMLVPQSRQLEIALKVCN